MSLEFMVPFYGDPGLLKETVASVQAQTDGDWRLTVVDDGYPDDSIPGWFATLGDERIRYLRNETNLGANKNYEKCLSLATADDVTVLGADDLLRPNYVSVLREARRRFPDAAVIQPGVEVVDEHGRPAHSLADRVKRVYAPRTDGPVELSGEDVAASLLKGNWLYFPALCFSVAKVREVGFREGLNVVQDLALVMDLLQRGESLVVDPTVCFAYRRHSSSDSSWRALEGTRFVEEREYFLTVAGELQARGWSRAARAARLHVSSRLHALTYLPAAVRQRHRVGMRNLSRHVFGGVGH
ncbi:glycosyltransferase family 2 protein [Blastococcus deserti]|uniref:Glycosyltransferase family 2 protein n=1 Tax=Blastococcus deserti TaxID=2259033 RepID=A0ABW4X7F0_9ACTN